MTADYGHKWYEYVYDEYYDCILCPEYKTLSYATTNREATGNTRASVSL
jgi:hypothetical protein